MRIRTTAAQFGAVDVADNISQLMTKLANNISLQLGAWHDVRFQDEFRDKNPSFADDRLIAFACNPKKCPLNRSETSGVPFTQPQTHCHEVRAL
ncbi:MAG: hypothetical protein SGI74_13915 [Oligoflexia bacterium]|nr:hypothetical protein [Oligoflexia bacterium]